MKSGGGGEEEEGEEGEGEEEEGEEWWVGKEWSAGGVSGVYTHTLWDRGWPDFSACGPHAGKF